MKKILIAYFSYSGKTKAVAEHVAAVTNGGLFEIKVTETYPAEYKACVKRAVKELVTRKRPSLAQRLENLSLYDTVVIGFPNWCETAPMPVVAFLESYDFSGKDIYFFVTSGSSGVSRSERAVRKACKSGIVHEGIDGNHLTDAAIQAWLGL